DAVWLPDEAGERSAAETAWARRFLQALQPHRAGGVYVNFLDSDDDSSRVREAYGDQIYRRLAEVKAKYDPDNAFHHNKNIRPGGRTPAEWARLVSNQRPLACEAARLRIIETASASGMRRSSCRS